MFTPFSRMQAANLLYFGALDAVMPGLRVGGPAMWLLSDGGAVDAPGGLPPGWLALGWLALGWLPLGWLALGWPGADPVGTLDPVVGVAVALVIVVVVVEVVAEPELPQAASPRALSSRTVRAAAVLAARAGSRLVLLIRSMWLPLSTTIARCIPAFLPGMHTCFPLDGC